MSQAANLLNKLVKEKSPPKAKAKTPDRPIKVVPELGDWVASATIFDVIEARKDVEAAPINEKLMDEFAEQLFNQGFQPVNPRVVTMAHGEVDHQANFTVQAKFKLQGKTSDELKANLYEVLGSDDLFDGEIDCTPLTTLRPFNELVIGHYEGKDFVPATKEEEAVATKLLQFVQGQFTSFQKGYSIGLTDAERDLVLIHQDQMKVKPGFMDRVKTYCKTVDELKGVFKVITPVHFLSHAKFAVADTPQARQDRLVAAVGNFLGESEEFREAA
jgi:hypothetical protein